MALRGVLKGSEGWLGNNGPPHVAARGPPFVARRKMVLGNNYLGPFQNRHRLFLLRRPLRRPPSQVVEQKSTVPTKLRALLLQVRPSASGVTLGWLSLCALQ